MSLKIGLKKLVQLSILLKGKIMSCNYHSGKFKTGEMIVHEKFQDLDKEIQSWKQKLMKNNNKLIVFMMKFQENKHSQTQKKGKFKAYNLR